MHLVTFAKDQLNLLWRWESGGGDFRTVVANRLAANALGVELLRLGSAGTKSFGQSILESLQMKCSV